MTILFWILFFAVFYTYIGYAILLFFLTIIKKKRESLEDKNTTHEWPEVSLFITAYNEKNILKEKIENCLSLDYPKTKLRIVFVTDGSNDGSQVFLKQIPEITVYHEDERRGKINAMNRGMQFITSPIVIFTDANTSLNKEAIKVITSKFFDPTVGCVAGSKKVISTDKSSAAEAGEGIYWKFESWLKEKDAEFHSAVGAVGELFAIRTELFEPVPSDTVLDDFMISFNIVSKGYFLKYAPNAIASETASFNVAEELKRKVRIAAGGIQTFFRMKHLLNPFRYGKLSFQYFSHKVTRWTFAPWCFFLLYPVNTLIVLSDPENYFYFLILILQSIFYVIVLLGWIFEKINLRVKLIFLPYYFTAINFATIRGQFRYFSGKQSAAWDKAKRL
jgi:cellulose synthase/poly-beta-1,6-N-acetylglucosamine synthase-like glycosyltransferase